MLLGHTGMNWALRYARAYQVNIVLLGEPIGATTLAAFLPGIQERPTGYTLLGGALVLGGILLAERRRQT
jgi:drug/metabolite transporter (DMT)-like permease